jgi:hypothetical protein
MVEKMIEALEALEKCNARVIVIRAYQVKKSGLPDMTSLSFQ